jgi:hypothetical protein
MVGGIFFLVAGVTWIFLRKPIAGYQYRILTDMRVLRPREPEQQVNALAMLGLLFSFGLILCGTLLLIGSLV